VKKKRFQKTEAIAHCKLQISNCKLTEGVMTPEGLLDRLIIYAASVGKLVDSLADTRMGRHIAGQLLRCGTAPAPNYAEACAAESPADFVHKLRIALKELREAETWLRIVVRASLLPEATLHAVLDECQQLSRIVGASIVTTRRNQHEPT
jgi:four helix bundle protein